MSAIDLRNIRKTYTGKKGKMVEALSDISLTVMKGEVFGFLGPNGAGKSTTIKILMGMINASAGEAFIFETPVSKPEARLSIGYLPENPSFHDFLTAREYLSFVAKSFGMENGAIARETGRVIELLSLTAAADRPIKGYSKGMVQRLGLAQALIHDPDIFILDEPMSGLDPIGRALVKEIMRDLKGRGKTIFFSTHITADVEVVCDRVGIIVGGVLQKVYDVEKLLKSGIEGYEIHVSGYAGELPADFPKVANGEVSRAFYVPRERLQEFVEAVSRDGGIIDIIEPKRKDLETYFLDIVGRTL